MNKVVEQISRVDGVGDVQEFGAGYAMRIWLDPDKLRAYSLTPGDVVGGAPGAERAVLGRPARRHAAARRPADQCDRDGARATARRSSISRTSSCAARPTARRCGCATWRASSWAPAPTTSRVIYNGKPATGFGVSLATGANALATADRIKARIAQMRPEFPARA